MARPKRRSKAPPRSVNHARVLVADLLSGQRDAVNALHALKALDDAAAVQHFLERVGHIPAVRQAMLGAPRVNTYSEFGRTPNPAVPVGSLSVELLFTAFALSFEAEQVAEFVERRQSFECALIRGDADEAARCREQIERRHGKSLWLVESEVLCELVRLEESTNAEAFMERLFSEVQGNPYLLLAVCTLYLRGRREEAPSANLPYIRQIARKMPNLSPATVEWWVLRSSPAALITQHEEELANFLRESSSLPVVDRYLALRRTLMTLAAAEISSEVRQASRSALAMLSRFVDEPWIAATRRALGEHGHAAADAATEVYVRCLDLYTVGDYSTCVKETRLASERFPSRLEFHELYARSAICAGGAWEPMGPPRSIMHDVSDALHERWLCSRLTREAVENLEALANLLPGLQIGEQLFRALPPSSPLLGALSGHYHVLASTCPTPRDPLLFGDVRSARAILQDLRRRFPSSVTVRAFTAVLLPEGDEPPAVPPGRMAELRALAALAEGRYADAHEHLERASEDEASSIVERQETAAMQIRAFLGLDWIEECVRLIADVFVERPPMLIGLPLDEVFEHLTTERLAKSPGIDSPLALLAIQAYAQVDVDSYQIYVAYDEFLVSRGCGRPTQLRPLHEPGAADSEKERRKLVAFLRGACVIHVLDHSPTFQSQQDVENERIELCAWLAELDPARKVQYEQEQVKLVRTQTIRQAIQRVERSKVYVDIEGIRLATAKQLADDFARIKEMARVEDSLRKLADVQGDSGVLAQVKAGFVVSTFAEVFERIKRDFLRSDAYGLDANLSIRIRHGTLTGHLRGHFERFRLVTPRDSKHDEYERNAYWLDGGSVPAGLEEPADRLLREFARAVDRSIEQVKDEWLQIRTAERPGLFDYQFTAAELGLLARRAAAAKDVEEFGDVVFQALWRRTEDDSNRVSMKIQEDLRATLTGHLDALETGLLGLDGELRGTRLHGAIVRCRAALQSTLASVAGWFDVRAVQPSQDYRFDLLADTCVATIRRSLSSERGKRIRSVVKGELPLLRGRHFEHFFALTHILLDNAVRHGRPDADVALEISGRDGSITVRVTNEITAAQVEELAPRLRELEQRARHEGANHELHREGGTGFFKLGKIIRVDLRASDFEVVLELGDGCITTSARICAGELFT